MSFNPTAVDFHPFAEEYPMMPALELGRMEEGMRRWGFDPLFPIMIYQGKILDGRNRFVCAKALDIEPPYIFFEGNDDDARAFVQRANEERRHLAQEWLQRRRAERIERVAERRQEGASLRTIADEEGVSESQVRQDIEKASTAQGCAVEPEGGKVEGKDGRTRTAHPAKPEPETPPAKPGDASEESPIICGRCFRMGKAVRGCQSCDRLRKQAAKAAEEASARAEANEPEPEQQDEAGQPIPEHVLTAFAAADEIGELCRDLDALLRRAEALALGTGGRLIRFDSVKQQIKDARANLWNNRATHVCPYCNAVEKKCEACKGQGWVAKHIYDQAPSTTGNSTNGRKGK